MSIECKNDISWGGWDIFGTLSFQLSFPCIFQYYVFLLFKFIWKRKRNDYVDGNFIIAIIVIIILSGCVVIPPIMDTEWSGKTKTNKKRDKAYNTAGVSHQSSNFICFILFRIPVLFFSAPFLLFLFGGQGCFDFSIFDQEQWLCNDTFVLRDFVFRSAWHGQCPNMQLWFLFRWIEDFV